MSSQFDDRVRNNDTGTRNVALLTTERATVQINAKSITNTYEGVFVEQVQNIVDYNEAEKKTGWLCQVECQWRASRAVSATPGLTWTLETSTTNSATTTSWAARNEDQKSPLASLAKRDLNLIVQWSLRCGQWVHHFSDQIVPRTSLEGGGILQIHGGAANDDSDGHNDRASGWLRGRVFLPPCCLRRTGKLWVRVSLSDHAATIKSERGMGAVAAFSGQQRHESIITPLVEITQLHIRRIDQAVQLAADTTMYEALQLQLHNSNDDTAQSVFNKIHGDDVYTYGEERTLGHWLTLRSSWAKIRISATRLHYTAAAASAIERLLQETRTTDTVLLHESKSVNRIAEGMPESDTQGPNVGSALGGLGRGADVKQLLMIDHLLEPHSETRTAALILAQCILWLNSSNTIGAADSTKDKTTQQDVWQPHSANALSPTKSSGSQAGNGMIFFADERIQTHRDLERHLYEVAQFLPAHAHVVLWGNGEAASLRLDSALTLRWNGNTSAANTPVYTPSQLLLSQGMLPNTRAHCAFSLSRDACRHFQNSLIASLIDAPDGTSNGQSPTILTNGPRERTSNSPSHISDDMNPHHAPWEHMIAKGLCDTLRALVETPNAVYICNPPLFVMPRQYDSPLALHGSSRAPAYKPSDSAVASRMSMVKQQGAGLTPTVQNANRTPFEYRNYVDAHLASSMYRSIIPPNIEVSHLERSSAYRASVVVYSTHSDMLSDQGGDLLRQAVQDLRVQQQSYSNIELLCADVVHHNDVDKSIKSRSKALKALIMGLGLNESLEATPFDDTTRLIPVTVDVSNADTTRMLSSGSGSPDVAKLRTDMFYRAAQQATGEFILFWNMDDDATSAPNRLAQQVAVLLCSQFVVCSCERGLNDSKFSQRRVQRVALQEHQFELSMYRRRDLLHALSREITLGPSAGTSNVLMKTEQDSVIGDRSVLANLFNVFATVAKANGADGDKLNMDETASYARLSFYHCLPLKLVFEGTRTERNTS